MLKEYRLEALSSIWGGLLLSFFGYLLSGPASPYQYFGSLILGGGYLLTLCGSFLYARGKGYSWWVGGWGVLGPAGLLVLYVLRDKSSSILKKRRREEA